MLVLDWIMLMVVNVDVYIFADEAKKNLAGPTLQTERELAY